LHTRLIKFSSRFLAFANAIKYTLSGSYRAAISTHQ
jgi:hypothetical protein